MNQRIILLNGASSSGKSTLACNLQALIRRQSGEDYAIVSIDDFLTMAVDKAIYEEDVFEISFQLCRKALDFLECKRGVIIEHVITSERIFRQLSECLQTYGIYMIHVVCPLHELKRREDERRNRCNGSAEASEQYLFPKEGYDLTVDTFETSAEDCSLQIMNGLAKV